MRHRIASSALIVGLTVAAWGCDNKPTTTPPPVSNPTPPTTPGGKAASQVGVLNLDKLLTQLNWRDPVTKNQQETQAAAEKGMAVVREFVTKMEKDRIDQFAAKYIPESKRADFLKITDIREFEHAGVPKDEVDKFLRDVANDQRNLQIVAQNINSLRSAYQSELDRSVRSIINNAEKAVAKSKGIQVVIPVVGDTNTYYYYEDAVDITDDVVQDLRTHNKTDFPNIRPFADDMQKYLNNLSFPSPTAPPATQPAASKPSIE